MQGRDWVWLALVVAAAVAFSVWGLPYFTQLGHPLLSLLVYGFFVLLFIYGRCNRIRTSKLRDNKQESPVSQRR